MAYRTIEVHTKSTNFRQATRIVVVAELPNAPPGHVVVKNHYVGINATDVNVTNGAYFNRPLPFSCGLEGVGEVVSIGEAVTNFQTGDAIAYQTIGAFSEYVVVPAATAIKGISGSIAPDEVGQIKSGETVLVTAAAGGTGQFVVQLAKLAGNHVIGTTSSDEKAAVLKALGVDRVINYNQENVDDVLKKEYPNGVDLVFEMVGGESFKTAVENLAVHGRVVAFGYISGYLDGISSLAPFLVSQLTPMLMGRSASVRGFVLQNHVGKIPEHFGKLFKLIGEGKLKPGVDKTQFTGLEGIADAIENMYARKNIGKLVIKLV